MVVLVVIGVMPRSIGPAREDRAKNGLARLHIA
jgi:hypothetical protein